MQIVIDIPEVFYESLREADMILSGQRSGKTFISVIYSAVANGKPLPKGHGRIGDLDRVRAKIFNASMDEHFMPIKSLTCDDVTDIIDDIPTIIEADKEK